jgi:hypothetical protein
MVTRTNNSFTPVFAVFSLLITASIGNAAYQELKTPSVARAKGFADSDYKKIAAVLERKDCKFLGGSALNAMTSLRYGGDSIALNKFVEALSQCPNVIVSVNFFRPGPGASECDWMVTHEPLPRMKFVVRINLESKNIKLESLCLPPVKAEKAAADEN